MGVASLDHFEGRTRTGWHHQNNIVTAAYFSAHTLGLDADPKSTPVA